MTLQGFMQTLFVGTGHPKVPHRIGPLAVQLYGSFFGSCFAALHPGRWLADCLWIIFWWR